MRVLTPLCELAIKHSTDKGGRHNTYDHQPCHGTHEYTPVYFDLFSKQRLLVQSVLEIGINRGCSLRMWKEFFPNATITGLDNNPDCLFNEDRIKSYLADQSDPHSIANALQKAQTFPFDVIIDDGSHDMMDQVVTMNSLAPRLLTDIGVYVIEDIPRSDVMWQEYLIKHTPDGMVCGIIVPEKGTGTINEDVLYVATRE